MVTRGALNLHGFRMAPRSWTGALGAGGGVLYTNPFGTASPFPQLNFLLSQPSPPTTWFL